MAMSYFTESEAPRDFRVSSTESDGHYTKCLLCYTVKRNFYCAECVRAGNFVHSSMPYSDRFAEKQVKLVRVKANRRHVQERCERLLQPRAQQHALRSAAQRAHDHLRLLRLAIQQRQDSLQQRRDQLTQLTNYNNELRLKLPRYQKRVSSLGKHAQGQRCELAQRAAHYQEQAQALAALRRSRIRQLTKYIFPVYITYDTSDSIEDLEFVRSEGEGSGLGEVEEPPRRAQLHVGAPWLPLHGDLAHLADDLAGVGAKEGEGWPAGGAGAGVSEAARVAAALGLAAQLVALLATTIDCRLPHKLALNEYYTWCGPRGTAMRARRLGACAGALCARSGLSSAGASAAGAASEHGHGHGLRALDALCVAAHADTPPLGRVEAWLSSSVACAWALRGTDRDGDGEDADRDDAADEPPEHLHWPDPNEAEDQSAPALAAAAAPAPSPSLVTSAAASLVSMWRGWTK